MSSAPSKSSSTAGEPSDQSKSSNAYSAVNEQSSSTIYITASCLEGTVMKESLCTNLLDLLANDKDICFENSSSSDGFEWLSPFMQEIFKKTVFIAFKKFEKDGSFFKFDPADILILKDEGLVLEVGISESQLLDVVGPFAQLLCSTLFTGVFTRKCVSCCTLLVKRTDAGKHCRTYIPDRSFGQSRSNMSQSYVQESFSRMIVPI